MTTRRDTPTGRQDTLGRHIKVSATAAGNTTTAPAPPTPPEVQEPSEPTSKELEAAVAAARKDVENTKLHLADQQDRVVAAEQALLQHHAAAITERFRAKTAEQHHAVTELRTLIRDYPATGGTSKNGEQLRQAAKSLSELASENYDLGDKARTANDWPYDHPELDDDEQIWRLVDDANKLGEYGAALSRANGRTGQATNTKAFRSAIETIKRCGYNDGHGLPCTNCGQPQYGYDDEDYYCDACRR